MDIKPSFSHKTQEPEKSVLYIVATPIGNLNDLSQRAINVLKNVSLIACEDTRQTKKIMNKYEFNNNLTSFNKHNSQIKTQRIINELKSGKSFINSQLSKLNLFCKAFPEIFHDKLMIFTLLLDKGPATAKHAEEG